MHLLRSLGQARKPSKRRKLTLVSGCSALRAMDRPHSPIVISLGRRKRKSIRALERSEGPLFDDVLRALAEVQRSLGPEATDKVLLPIAVVYERKRRRRKSLLALFA